MQQKMGYLLIGVGVVLIVWGAVVVAKPKQEVSTKVEQVVEPVVAVPEVSPQDESYAKGLAFEEFVVKRFDPDFFTIKEWRGDKQVDGVYAESNTYPDLVVNFNYRKEKVDVDFAVECKWRQGFLKNEVEWSYAQQIERYNQFSREKNLPVFIALGIGGEPDSPEQMYIVPLDKLQKPSVSFDELKIYRRQYPDRNLYWDTKEGVLK